MPFFSFYAVRVLKRSYLQPTPQSSSAVNTSDWITSLAAIADGQSLLPSSPNVLSGEHDTFYAKSLVTPSPSVGAAMSDASLQAFAAYMGNQGYSSDTQWFVQVELYGGKESKIVNVDPDATSFASRNQLFTIQFRPVPSTLRKAPD